MSVIGETVLEIDLNALEYNYHYLRSKIPQQTKFLGVVKAFAYGSDSVKIAQKLVDLGVDYLAVAYVNEGVTLRKAGIEKPILVFHPQSGNFKTLVDHCLTPTLYSQFMLNNFVELAESLQQKDYPVHLNFNTGMNRLGFSASETGFITKKLQQTEAIKVDGIYSHFAASDDDNECEFTFHQLEKFINLSAEVVKNLDYKPLLHLCNTSGILNYPEAHFDMVRPGIGLYGYGNSAEEDKNLQPVGTLKTLISQIHQLEKGDSVGYNRKFFAKKPTKIATLPLGHADGLNRIYGHGKVNVSINGDLAPIVGNVCMDMVMVDITGIKCREGDEVIIFGKDKSAEKLANSAGTISYELITSISQRVKRKIIC